MMKTASGWSVLSDEKDAADQALDLLLKKLPGRPHLLLVHSSCRYDNQKLLQHLKKRIPDIPVQGGTSCLGVMTDEGFHSQVELGIGLFGIHDPEGAYGVGFTDAHDKNPDVRAAMEQAIRHAGRPGEIPAVVIVSCYPGIEESMIASIEDYVGPNVPIIGGTSADNDMSGQWQQFADYEVFKQAITVAVPRASFSPLGMIVTKVGGIAYHLLSYPAACLLLWTVWKMSAREWRGSLKISPFWGPLLWGSRDASSVVRTGMET